MSDDIKVKFGGDFSALASGAKEAGEAAGVAMTSSFSSFTSKLSSSLISALGVGAVATSLVSNIFERFSQFKELDSMSKKLGVSAEDLQKFGRMGKEVGIDMETMGRGIAFANKYIGQAQLGAVANREELQKLGFTQQQINGGNLKAIDILLALAKSYEENGSETIAAAQAQTIFGRTGMQMVGVIKQGTEAIKEQMAVMAKYSDEEVKRGAEVEKRLEKGKKFWEYHFGGKQAATIGYAIENSEIKEMLKNAGVDISLTGLFGNEADTSKDKNKMKQVADSLVEQSKRLGLSLTSVSDILYDKSQQSLRTAGSKEFYEQLSGMIYNIAMQQEQSKPKPAIAMEAIEPAKALVTSSLQAIGGGDITSVFAGIDYQKTTAEQITMANQYLQQIAISQTKTSTNPPTSLAK